MNMDNPTVIMGVEPVEARSIRSNPHMRGDEGAFAIDIDGDVRMDVHATLLGVLAGNVVYRRIHHQRGRRLMLPHDQGDKAGNYQYTYRNETDGRAAPGMNDALLLFFTPVQLLAVFFWP